MIELICAARLAGSSTSQYKAASPQTSGIDAARDTIVGQPQLIASKGGKPNPS
jgi:hypothetical protein